MQRIQISREELYEKVWQVPMMHLAKEFGISDRGLAKTCKRLEIPLPGLGYWRKVELGISVKKAKLPPPSEKCQLNTSFLIKAPDEEVSIDQSDIVLQVTESESKPENQIIVPQQVHKYHPLVKKTLESLVKSRSDEYGRGYASPEELLDIRCSKKCAHRAARIFHTLIQHLEKRGHSVVLERWLPYYHRYESGTFIEYFGESLKVYLMETSVRTDHVPAKNEIWGPKYDYTPSGQLILKVEEYGYNRFKKTWSDTSKKRLEDQLNSFLIGLAKLAVYEKREREKKEQERLERERQREYQEMLRLKAEEEQKRREHLDQLVYQWVKASRIRQFLEKATLSDIDFSQDGMTQEEWLCWAYNYVDQLDPFPKKNQRPVNSTKVT